MFIGIDTLFLLDFSARHKVLEISLSGINSACLINDTEIMAATFRGEFFVINTNGKHLMRDYMPVKEDPNALPLTNVVKLRSVSVGKVAVTSLFSGFSFIDIKKSTYSQYLHNPLVENSISENRVTELNICKDNIFVATINTGLNYFNLKDYKANYIGAFTDVSGHIFDSYINGIFVDRQNKVWLAGFDRIIVWDRAANTTRFFSYNKDLYNTGSKPLEVKAICQDNDGKIWAAIYEEGVVQIDEKKGNYRLVAACDSASKVQALKSSFIQDVYCDKEGMIWVCSGLGVLCINAKTLHIDSTTYGPYIRELQGKRVNKIWADASGRLWFATTNFGAYCYDKKTQKLVNYFKTNSIPSYRVFCFAEDKAGNIYIATYSGLAILRKNGEFKIYNDKNGLRSNACYGLQADKEGRIWISNLHNTMVCYNPADSSFQYFSEESGFGQWGFRGNSFGQAPNGEMFWGSDRGLNYFYPDRLSAAKPLTLSIQKLSVGDSLVYFTNTDSVVLPYEQHNLQVHFTAVDLYSSSNIFYKYELEGYDTKWTIAKDINFARYNLLPPGHYVFKVMASRDGITWVESQNKIHITISTPFWKSWWYIGLVCLFALTGLSVIIIWRERDIKAVEIEKTKVQELTAEQYKNELELEQISNFFSTSFINKNDIAEVLKEVTKNLINKLGFEDCVIYLWNEDNTKLVQKAGYGPLGYLDAIEKPVFDVLPGQGVVGHVAQKGEPLIIPDTSIDPRYRADEMVRLSEICVPIRYNDELIGVIDSEHHERNFFNQRHLRIMATIATMIAAKIKSLESEQALQQRKNELQIVQRQLAQVQLAGLRSQINPHFIFNSLNSINTFILKNDTENASDYLNKFSRLMRMILDNSRSEWVMLESELSALKLYIELEALRFENVFSYRLVVSPEVSLTGTLVPPLLIQPYVENAIWHGLMHRKEPGGNISVHVWKRERTLIIEIDDNGIGRQASANLKTRSHQLQRSLGMQITAERLAIVGEVYKVVTNVKVTDLYSADIANKGTKVILTFEYRSYEGNHS